MKDVIVSWSGGKDCTLAVYKLQKTEEYTIKGLLSTTSEASGRVPMHEVGRRLIHAQAESLGFPLYEVKLPANPGNDEYERSVRDQMEMFKKNQITTIVHGDLFLEDIRNYRDENLAKADMKGLYPLWGRETVRVAEEFIANGFKAIITTVDTEKLPRELVGTYFDETFLQGLPEDVDPCGEYGEFHTFVFDGPIFSQSIHVKPGERFTTMDGRFAHIELS